jgi:hypothetical protein
MISISSDSEDTLGVISSIADITLVSIVSKCLYPFYTNMATGMLLTKNTIWAALLTVLRSEREHTSRLASVMGSTYASSGRTET